MKKKSFDKITLTNEEKIFFDNRKLKDKYFIGRFNETKSGYLISDIRRSDFSKIKYKPGNAKTFTIKVLGTLDQISSNDSYYRFTWKMVKSKPYYVFEVDKDKEITPIFPEDIVKLLYEDIYDYPASASEKIVNTLDTLKNQLTASGKEVFVYELLQNANDYPQIIKGKKVPVDVEFHITERYLVFQHSGDYFDPKNIAAICSINDKEKTDNSEAIGYKGIGFKTVFLDNDYVLLRTGDYQFRFDYEYTKNIEDTPWQILPIWTKDQEVDDEVLDVIDVADDKYRVQIALRPTESDILHYGEQNYEELFSDVFETERVILFIPYVNSVSVYMEGEDEPSIVRIKENDKWCVSDPKRYVGDIPKDLTEELNRRIDKNDGKIPEKYYNFSKTSIGFACRRKGNVLLPVENSCLYCYLPAKKAKLGFGFLMNTDMIPTGPRDNVEPKEKINHAIAKIAGEQFFNWIHDLLESGDFDYESVFSLIPDFDELKKKYDEDEDALKFITEFKEGFEESLKEGDIVPVLDENGNTILMPVSEVSYDVTGISCTGLMSDEELLRLTDWSDCFVHPDLRDTEKWRLKPSIGRFMLHYVADGYTFDKDVLLGCCENKDFAEWLSDKDNNCEFINFLLVKDYITDFKDKAIFLTETDRTLQPSTQVYYDIDEYYEDLEAFDDYLPRLAMVTRNHFADDLDRISKKNQIFKKFDADNFVNSELLHPHRIADTHKRLEEPKTSFGFFNFLANNVGFTAKYKNFPIINFKNTVIEDFNRIIYFYSEEGENLYNESWIEDGWINLVSEEYSSEAKKNFEENFDVKEFSIQGVVDDVLLEDTDIQDSISNLGADHIDFVQYCYAHKECFKKDSLMDFTLWTYDKDGENVKTLPKDVIFFDSEEFSQYQSKAWIKNGWMYKFDEDYLDGIEDIVNFRSFIADAFAVKDFNQESFYHSVVAIHDKEICSNVGGTDTDSDTEESIDILYYLGENFKLIFEDNSNDRFVHITLYRFDVWDKVTDRATDVFLYNEDLQNLIEADWTPEDFVYMLEEKYNDVFAKYPKLRKKLDIKTYSFKSIKDILLDDITSLSSSIEEREENISFHRFMFQNADDISNADYKKLNQLELIVVDNQGNESSHDIDESLYISNAYMEKGKGMEAMVKKYDETAVFTSNAYLNDKNDVEEASDWKEYFIKLGVNSDNKDIIFNSVLPNLSEIKDKDIVSLLANYYDYFHADGEWDNALRLLKKVNVVIKGGDNEFLPLKDVIFNDCYKAEPFSYLVIEDEIADFYHKSPDVMRLLREIVDGSKQDKSNDYRSFKTVEEWKKEKLDWYLYLQQENINSLAHVHTQFIQDLAKDYSKNYDHYTKVKVKEIKLLGKDGLYHNAIELTEGAAYQPRCNFEKYGIPLTYLSECYLPVENPDPKEFRKLFTDMEVVYDFRSEHLPLMRDNYKFTVYFWTDYLTQYANRTHITAAGVPKDPIVKELNNYATIPTGNIEKQEVKKPGELYSQSLIQDGYVKNMVPFCYDKMPLERIFSTDEVKKILDELNFLSSLSFSDCLECLLRTQHKTKRQRILSWLALNKSIDHVLANKYLEDERSVWKNGRGEFVRLKDLLVLHIADNRLRQLFGKNSKVLSQEYMDSTIVFEAFCRIFMIESLTADDFELTPSVIEEPTTEEMRQKLRLPLLIIAAVSSPDDWESTYDSCCQKLDELTFHRCDSITLNYQGILKDSCIQYHKSNNDLFFVRDWMGRRVFKDLISDLVDCFDIDLDNNVLESIFEADERNQADLIEQYVSYELARDNRFLATLKDLNATIAAGVHVSFEEDGEDENASSFGTNTREEIHSNEDFDCAHAETSSSNTSGSSHEASNDGLDEEYEDGDEEVTEEILGTEASFDADDDFDDISDNEVTNESYIGQRKTRSDFGGTHNKSQNSSPTHSYNGASVNGDNSGYSGSNYTDTERSLVERLDEKWDKKAKSKVGRPMSSPTKTSVSGEIQSRYTPNNTPSAEPFFEDNVADASASWSGARNGMSKTSQNIKRKNTEAQNSARNAADQEELFDLWSRTPMYTFLWFKCLMELQYSDRSKMTRRTAQIEFRNFEILSGDDVVRLLDPSTTIPTWIEYADVMEITLIGKTVQKLEASIVNVKEAGVGIKIDPQMSEKFHGVKKIRVYAENSSNIIDSLTTRFLQLDYDDSYNLEKNLPKNIQFIYGPPGTGKTTRLVEMLNELVDKSDDKLNILVLTPTNKAADVIATKLVDDDACYQYLTRFGSTESQYLIEDAAVLQTRDTADMDLLDQNIVVTTAARYSYDCVQPDDTPICDFNWDYIIVDEASMIDLVTITYILHKGRDSKFIIAGDPKQIQPVSQGDVETQNIYQMIGLDSFRDAIESYSRYPIEALTVQHRSVPSIGNLVSKFSYNGMLKNDAERAPQKPLNLDGILTNDINFIGFNIEEFDRLYGLTSIKDSAFHLYSAIFTYNMVDYVVKQLTHNNPDCEYSIGIVCPYKAEADAIKQMLDHKSLNNEKCTVTSGTVHKFQGDECDIMFIVLNPPANISSGSHVNKDNIINVAMSRARDYLFFIVPDGQIDGFNVKNRLGKIVQNSERTITHCSNIEQIMFSNSNYIYENTNVSCHLPVNVYYDTRCRYEVRIDDSALDIQINDDETERK